MEETYCGRDEEEEFYKEESIFELREDDELTDVEEGFMIGYMGS